MMLKMCSNTAYPTQRRIWTLRMLRLVSLVVMMTSKNKGKKKKKKKKIWLHGGNAGGVAGSMFDVFHSRAHRRGAR